MMLAATPTSAVHEQTEFDFLCPIQKAEGIMTPDVVAKALRFNRSTIYDMMNSGELEYLCRESVDKAHKRITRRSFLAWCARSISIPPDEFIITLFKLARTLNERQRRELIVRLQTTLPNR